MLALFGCQLFRKGHIHRRVEIAVLLGLADRRHAVSLETEYLSVLARRRALEPAVSCSFPPIAPPKNVWKKSENGSASPNISRISSSVIVRKPPPAGPPPILMFQAPPCGPPGKPGPPCAPVCSYMRQ